MAKTEEALQGNISIPLSDLRLPTQHGPPRAMTPGREKAGIDVRLTGADRRAVGDTQDAVRYLRHAGV